MLVNAVDLVRKFTELIFVEYPAAIYLKQSRPAGFVRLLGVGV
jgi:hypothetical protein